MVDHMDDTTTSLTLSFDPEALAMELQDCGGGRLPDTNRADILVAHASLFDKLANGIPGALRTAAEAGLAEAVLMEFRGEDTFHGVDILYLIRGPRKFALRRHGMPEPVLFGLRRALGPKYRVIHEWDCATHTNKVIVRRVPLP